MRRLIIFFCLTLYVNDCFSVPDTDDNSQPYFLQGMEDEIDTSVIMPTENNTEIQSDNESPNSSEEANGIIGSMGNGLANIIGNTIAVDLDNNTEHKHTDNNVAVIDIDSKNQSDFENQVLNYNENQQSLRPGQKWKNIKMFDIQGIYLGQSYSDVEYQFFHTKNLYTPITKNSIIYTIPDEWKYNLDYECRQNGLIIPKQIKQCIITTAKKRGLLYPSEILLERKNTGEKIYVFFTSNLTNNVVWKIVYQNDVNDLEGDGKAFEYQREKKILTFWQGVLDKYGQPNSGDAEWISSSNPYDPKMTAAYGELILEDKGLYAKDISENETESLLRFKAKTYAF